VEIQPAEIRRRKQRQDVRRAVLDATEELLLRDGYERFSIRRLAARCGYTAPTIYHHFGDKSGLIDALLDRNFGAVVQRMRRVPRGDDPAVYLRELARAFLHFGLERTTFYRLLTLPRPEAPAELPPSAEEGRLMVENALRDLAKEGRLATDDLDAASQTLWAMLDGVLHMRVSSPDYPWSKNLLDVALQAVESGLVQRRGD
jgi:AcrR family transcriptional regulator